MHSDLSLAVDRASDRRLADLHDAQDMADRQRECAWDDARREVQQSGVIDTDMLIEDHLGFDQQHLLSELIWHALQYGAATPAEAAECTERLQLAADALFESVCGSRAREILADRGLS